MLTVTEMLRRVGVVGAIVEFHGPGLEFLTLEDRVGMDLERVDPVFELVLFLDSLEGQLARLAKGNESCPDPVCDRCREGEATSLDSGDLGDPLIPKRLSHRIDQCAKSLRISQDRGDVLEYNALFREVRYVPDQFFEIVHLGNSTVRLAPSRCCDRIRRRDPSVSRPRLGCRWRVWRI